ncbi:SDR family oxidoreductase [Nonomuraea pusilla]|uniref:SDR family oxidoreductase n=1 Tax=Nonomuraea pusilla TaxID=46177 RepID=UPI00331E2C47
MLPCPLYRPEAPPRFGLAGPAGGVGTPDAIAHAVVWLASDEAAFVHGTVVDVDGGRTGVAVIAQPVPPAGPAR